MRDDFSTCQPLLVAATAVRRADENFQEHILRADTAPSFKLTAVGSEGTSLVQPRKRLPLKMVISEIASRDRDTVETEPEYMTVSPHMDNTSLHTFFVKKKHPSRRYLDTSLAAPEAHASSQSEHTFHSKMFEDCDKEITSSDCQSNFVEESHSEKGDECFKPADKKEVFPHGYYSTPCAKLRFNSLYGNEVLNNVVKTNDSSHIKKHKDGAIKTHYQNTLSAVFKDYDIDTDHEHDIADTNDNIDLNSYSLLHSPTNATSPVLLKSVHESTNEATILSSPSSSSSSYSSINICSGWSTEDEHEHINHKRELESDYTSENRFLHPLVNFKSKQWKAQNGEAKLLYTAETRNVSDWEPECDYTVSDLNCINSNSDQRYSSTANVSPIHGDSQTLHDEAESSPGPTFWYRMKYTRRTQTITLSTKPSGLPDSTL